MALYHILILAVVQGITEFLPISSSGHLILTSQILGWPDQGLIIDIATHIGTLFAVLLYFWRDILLMLSGLSRQITGRSGPGTRLALYVIVATIPVFLAGYFGKDFIGLNWGEIGKEMRNKIIFDGRRCLDLEKLTELGWHSYAIGRPWLKDSPQ